MLVSADWVVPVASMPIRGGGVLIDGDRIVAVGSAVDLADHPLAATRRDFEDCVITPGLVNAHTHLTLTALADVVPPLPFADWLPRLVAALKPWEVADHEASGIVGAEACLVAGVTCVGDIAYGAAEVARASTAGLGGVFYWELLGITPDEIDARLDYLRYPSTLEAFGPRVVCGLSAHSPYTSGPALLAAVQSRADELGVPTAIHIAESIAEVELMRDGTGPLAPTASRTAHGFLAPRTSTVRYLDAVGALAGTTAVHLCHLAAEDLPLLASRVRGAVTCPRSNAYLHNPVPSVAALIDAGVAVGIGTDSSASNRDLDLMAEVRALREMEPDLTAAQLFTMATLGGAVAVGVARDFGSLAPGRNADLAVFAAPMTADPVAAVVDSASTASAVAVMSAGRWRVDDGRLVASDDAASARAADARLRSLEALRD